MKRSALSFAMLLGTSAMFGVPLAAAGENASKISDPSAEIQKLLDPTYMMATVCGPANPRHSTAFRVPTKLAMAQVNFWDKADSDGPPLWANLGDHTYPISTKSEMAQRYFDQGVKLIYGFNHWEAIRAFKKGQELDPDCAMCYWGEALAWGPNINLPMPDDAVAPAYAAAQKALALRDKANSKEQLMIDAVVARYAAEPVADRSALDKAFSDGMKKVYEAYPGDLDAASIYAESLMDLGPWDYWESDKTTAKAHAAEAIAVIEKVLEEKPNHAGAIHLYIHLVEASTTPDRAEAAADRLLTLMPGSGHLVHMPSHIYYRVGRFLDSIDANAKAAKADERYFEQVEAEGIYRALYYPHNVHFLMASAQMAGDADRAIESAQKLDGLIPDAMAASEPAVEPIKSGPIFAFAQLSSPEATLALPKPSEELKYVTVAWHYGRALAHIANNDMDAAKKEGQAIETIRLSGQLEPYTDRLIPAPDVAMIAEKIIAARMMLATDKEDKAIKLLEEAAALQDKLNYTEPPYWYYPVRQTLGAALLKADKASEAETVFRQSLINYPNNAWALFGLQEAQKAQDKEEAASMTGKLFSKAWAGDKDAISLSKI